MVQFQISGMEIKCPSQAFWLIVLRYPKSEETRDVILGSAIAIAAFLAMTIALSIALEPLGHSGRHRRAAREIYNFQRLELWRPPTP
jgi:hypothetical protein